MTDSPVPRHPSAVHRCLVRAQEVLVRARVSDQAVLLGVSGGGDSMALLEIVGLLAVRLSLRLHVASIDHGLRPECGKEVQLVRSAAERWDAVFHAVELCATKDDEDSLRQLRRTELLRLAAENACGHVLLGHNKEDQIETLVLRFLRGAGLGGLAGMREANGAIVRPLLGLGREELRDMLRIRGATWAEDPTNATDRYARGRLRLSVLPAIESAFGAGVLDHLLDVAPRWRDDEEYLERETDRLLAYLVRRRGGRSDLDWAGLISSHPALRARALRRWIHEGTGRVPGSREIAEVERWLKGGKGDDSSLDIATGRLVRSGERLHLAPQQALEPLINTAPVDRDGSDDDSKDG